MRFGQLLYPLGLAAAAVAKLSDRAPEDAGTLMVDLNDEAYEALRALEEGSPEKRSSCNIFTATIRRDWAALSKKERLAYIDAVKCLQAKPSKSDPKFAPGARTRYDDFVAVHINQTTSIHGTANFLTWHRHFTWAYEQALKKECGYKGAQPYWNWFAHQDDINKSPVYDGSETSLGGTGSYVKHEGSWAATGEVLFAPGKGGGCVQSGPFTNLTVNLGPIRPGMRSLPVTPGENLGYNPHCLRRDISNDPMRYMTATNLANITIGPASHTIELFQNELQGRFSDKFVGMHSAGHYVSGGDATDVFASPVDPTFFLHHAQVDRVYWIWQVLHPKLAATIFGGTAIGGGGAVGKVTDALNMGPVGTTIKIKEAFDTLSGPYCYIYL
ncbi:common central domain of tyrosinase domain-containing protein [Sarocladium implicatum]|nr:common central domain of tyrosinase domain-containing protein [Sarocladium implicatum]